MKLLNPHENESQYFHGGTDDIGDEFLNPSFLRLPYPSEKVLFPLIQAAYREHQPGFREAYQLSEIDKKRVAKLREGLDALNIRDISTRITVPFQLANPQSYRNALILAHSMLTAVEKLDKTQK